MQKPKRLGMNDGLSATFPLPTKEAGEAGEAEASQNRVMHAAEMYGAAVSGCRKRNQNAIR